MVSGMGAGDTMWRIGLQLRLYNSESNPLEIRKYFAAGSLGRGTLEILYNREGKKINGGRVEIRKHG